MARVLIHDQLPRALQGLEQPFRVLERAQLVGFAGEAQVRYADFLGSPATAIVPKREPKLEPTMPMRAESISARAASQSITARPAATQFGALTRCPSTALSYWPGPSSASTAMPRLRKRSPYMATFASLKPSMPGIVHTAGMRPPW